MFHKFHLERYKKSYHAAYWENCVVTWY